MNKIVENAAQITPEWFRLKTRGTVAGISVETFKSYFADFYRLHIKYEGDSDLPRRMILKVPFAGNEGALEMGRAEIAAYRKMFEVFEGTDGTTEPLVPFFFAADIDEETGRSQLLLQDLSETHVCGSAKEDVAVWQWERAVETLADFHSRWWESDRLGGMVQMLTTSDIDSIEARMKNDLPKFFAEMDGEITPEIKKTYEAALEFLPGFWRERYTVTAGNTLIHGDAHSWNFLFPRREDGRALMIDLATLRVRPATNDLAYLMALKWRRGLRAQLELPLLRHYYAALISRGVQNVSPNYSWEDCLLSYRYSIMTHLFTPVGQCAGEFLSPTIWQDNFRRIIHAFEDLDCGELIV
jgi:Ecdysteroid kinase-like family